MANCFSNGSTTQTQIVKETTWGVTPANGGAQIPFVNNTLSESKEIIGSSAKFGDRMARYNRHGNVSIAGDIEVEMAHETFDVLLESVMMDTFGAGDVLTVGDITDVSFSCEVGDTNKNVYQLYKGLVVNQMNVQVSLGQLVSTTFSCIGKSLSESTTSFDTTPTPVPNKQPMYQADGNILIDGISPGIITDLSLTISNNIEPNMALGDDTPVCLSTSNVEVSGSVTLFLKDLAYINKFRNESTSALSLAVNDGNGNQINFVIPSAKWSSAETPVSGDDTRTVTMDFVGLYNSAAQTVLKIERS